VAGCGKLVVGCGRLWQLVVEGGRLWQGCGRLWQVVAVSCRLWQVVAVSGS
jgi:hypothetical protein